MKVKEIFDKKIFDKTLHIIEITKLLMVQQSTVTIIWK